MLKRASPRLDASGKEIRIAPDDTDRVFVMLTAYNSKNYYIYGWVNSPGRLPITGGETVLDALNFGGGLCPGADTSKIRIMRSFPKGSPVQMLPVNYDEITTGTDMSTNYQIVPNDRIVVPREPAPPSQGKSAGKAPVERKELPDALQAIPQYAGPSSTQPDGIHRGISDPRGLETQTNKEPGKQLDHALKDGSRTRASLRNPAVRPMSCLGPGGSGRRPEALGLPRPNPDRRLTWYGLGLSLAGKACFRLHALFDPEHRLYLAHARIGTTDRS